MEWPVEFGYVTPTFYTFTGMRMGGVLLRWSWGVGCEE